MFSEKDGAEILVQSIGLPFTKRCSNIQRNLLVPWGMRALYRKCASSYRSWQLSRELPTENQSPHAPFLLHLTAVSNIGVKAVRNYFKGRGKVKQTMYVILNCLQRRRGWSAQLELPAWISDAGEISVKMYQNFSVLSFPRGNELV